MSVIVRYFAAAKDLAACDEESIKFESGAITQEELRARLCSLHPRFAVYIDRMRLAVNGDFADCAEKIQDGDEVDVLPPVAGGSPLIACEITDEDISVDQLRSLVAHRTAGGIALFIGTVRDHADGKAVVRLDYEAHHELAQKEMQRVLESIVEQYPGVRIAVAHRVGSLEIGEVAVVVAVSAPHREEAFSACRAAIERIKQTVPIWKREWGPEGSATWVNLEPK